MHKPRFFLVAEALADAMLCGPSTIEGFAARAALALGKKHRWIRGLAERAFMRFGSRLDHGQRDELVRFIGNDKGYLQGWENLTKPVIRKYFLDPPRMVPRSGALAACALPDLATPGDVASWLGIPVGELDWFADIRGMNRAASGPMCHYRWTWAPKRSGGLRLIESPKSRLCQIQRRILREILDPVSVHAAAHGFRRGHSCKTFVAPHVGQRVVMRLDLERFFTSIPAARVNALFRTLGYPPASASVLTGLCTSCVPEVVFRRGLAHRAVAGPIPWAERRAYRERHLPQGAPTSPALANLCALHLDFRLMALADSLDGRYTRYADDLAFSGGEELRRSGAKFQSLVGAIALEEGFRVNPHKTRAMPASTRQVLTGIVVNDKPNLPRPEYDRLKALLHNCVRHGAASQNRAGLPHFRDHLQGRVSHVQHLNPSRGRKLSALLERIHWP